MILAEEPYPANFDAVVFIGYPVWAATLPRRCEPFRQSTIFPAKQGFPSVPMTVYPIGKFTSDLSIFPDLPSRVEITFEVIS